MPEPITGAIGAAVVAKAALASKTMESVEGILEGVEVLKKRIEPFKPAVRDLQLDYSDRRAILTVYVHAPLSVRRTFAKITMPVDVGFQLKAIRTGLGELVKGVVTPEDGSLSVRAAKLPESSEHFVFSFEGYLSQDAIGHLVNTNVSAAPLDDEGCDVYWLSSAIQKPEILERIYDGIQVDRVDVSVYVLLSRYFSTALPARLSRILQARHDLLRAEDSGDRNLKSKARHTLKMARRRGTFTERDLAEAIADLVSQRTLSGHVAVTPPYQVTRVDPEERRLSLVPERFTAHAATSLNYQQRTAQGSLKFARDAYKREVSERVAKLVPEERQEASAKPARPTDVPHRL